MGSFPEPYNDPVSLANLLLLLSFSMCNIRLWLFAPFFQNSLKNRELKTIHKTFRDCPVHFNFSDNLSRNSCILQVAKTMRGTCASRE